MKTLIKKLTSTGCLLAVYFIVNGFTLLTAQTKQIVIGTITEAESHQPVPYANVALFDSTGLVLKGGAISDMDGGFVLTFEREKHIMLRFSAVGFEKLWKDIFPGTDTIVNLGKIFIPATEIKLEGVIVFGERVKANAGLEKTIYNVSNKMQDATNTGTDVLKLIPGVQVDIRQNITLEGSSNITILVDGRERDRSYLSQLPAAQVDKVEVLNSSAPQYDAEATGVINIVLKKDRDAGLDGHVYIEVPASASEIYLFPAYSLNYGFRKLNFFTSYNGELAYLNIKETRKRKSFSDTGIDEIISNYQIRQKNWSHRFHYGFDYFLNKKNQLNFYGYYNPYSWEHDGMVQLQSTRSHETSWSAQKEDNDLNHGAFYSLYYKHIFDETAGHEVAVDVNMYNLKAKNETIYTNEATGFRQVNIVSPGQNKVSARIDYTLPVSAKIKLNTGIQSKSHSMMDNLSEHFSWEESTFAGYGALIITSSKLDLQLGLRGEQSSVKVNAGEIKKLGAWLPNFIANYKFSSSQNVRLSFSNSLAWPNFNQLNPYESMDDPFTLRSGNPEVKNEFRQNLSIEYSRRFTNSFISSRLFYIKTSDVINSISSLNNDGILEIRTNNLGTLHRAGIQFTGALTINKTLSVNPYFRIFKSISSPNSLAKQHGFGDNHSTAFESGFSLLANLSHNFTATMIFQYDSPVCEMQSTHFSDALYFVSIEKKLGQGFKVGAVSALPFAKTFTYQGSEIKMKDFHYSSEGTVMTSAVPLWLKFNYQFSSGKKRAKLDRVTEEMENIQRKGF